MSVEIINGKCQDRDKVCIYNGTVVCRECRILAGNDRLKNLFESGESRRKHARKV